MKRMIALILLFFTLLTFAACGQNDPEHATEASSIYKYDMLTDRVIGDEANSDTFYRPIKGGAIVMVARNDYFGYGVPSMEGNERLFVMFDETTKVMFPLCFNAGCDHTGDDCFSQRLFYGFGNTYWNVYQDRIISVGAYKEGVEMLHCYYYSLDGTVQEKSVFDMSELIRSDGDAIKDPYVPFTFVSYGTKVYIDVCDSYDAYTVNSEGNCSFNRWIVSFDIQSGEFAVVSNYVLPDYYEDVVSVVDITEEHISLCYIGLTDIYVDMNKGVSVVTDCTGEHKPESIMYSSGMLYYNGDVYVKRRVDKDGSIRYVGIQSRNEYLVPHEFGGGKFVVSDFIAETEKGMILRYHNVGEDWQDELYMEEENGIMKEFRKPQNWIYVSKTDYFDGSIDEPLFFNAELGTFNAE